MKQAKDIVQAAGMFVKRLNAVRVERFTIGAAARKIQKSWRRKQAAKQATVAPPHRPKPRRTND